MNYSKITNIVLYVKDLDTTYAFYKALGLDLNYEKHGNGPVHYSCNLGNAVLEFYKLTNENVLQSVKLGITVPSIKALQSIVERFNVGKAEDDWYLLLDEAGKKWLYDPNGFKVLLTEES